MRRHQDAGGPSSVSATDICGISQTDPALAYLLAEVEMKIEALSSGSICVSVPGSAIQPIGKLLTCRTKPRRLDARIVKRRPKILFRRRAWGPSTLERVTGREMIART